MPIYEYKCSSCAFQDDHLQKVSEKPLSTCPACGKKTYKKMLSAAGFQLKGSGWYATDFKGGGTKPAEAKGEAKADTKPDGKAEAKAETKSGSKGESKKATATPAVTTD
jgi:putative FmdB family regulatory protein